MTSTNLYNGFSYEGELIGESCLAPRATFYLVFDLDSYVIFTLFYPSKYNNLGDLSLSVHLTHHLTY
ncbi:MAG: hypothetical protein ACTSWN_06195 [Promethearchaeota archaeon]